MNRQKRNLSAARILTPLLALVLALSGSAGALFGRSAEGTRDAPPVPAASLTVRTWRDIPCQARFPEEGGYTLVSEPRNGAVELLDGGRFTYTPAEGFTGRDRFVCAASDEDGTEYARVAVSVRVEKPRSGVRYADMDGDSAAFAAQELAEAGIFTGERMGGRYYFHPDQTLSREEFLALTMEALELDAPAVTRTGFSDDAAIPVWAKAYAASGVAHGLVRGTRTESGPAFQGDAPVTWGQAAAILNRALRLEDADLDEWFGDRAAVSSWAGQSVGNLEAAGVLAAGSFGSLTMEAAATRRDAALMLSAARAAAGLHP